MPSYPVVVTAHFEDINDPGPVEPVPTYSVRLDSDGSGETGGGDYRQGETVNIYAGTPPEGKQFKNWTADRPVTFANVNNADTTFTMPNYPVVVTAHFEDVEEDDPGKYNNGGGGGCDIGLSRILLLTGCIVSRIISRKKR
jgi:hypothetical protein